MRLADCRPEWGRIYRDLDGLESPCGSPTEDYWLTFVCPACGPPGSIKIRVGPDRSDGPPRRWKAEPLPDGPDWPSRATLSPSIAGTTHGPRRPQCTFHATLINGEFL